MPAALCLPRSRICHSHARTPRPPVPRPTVPPSFPRCAAALRGPGALHQLAQGGQVSGQEGDHLAGQRKRDLLRRQDCAPPPSCLLQLRACRLLFYVPLLLALDPSLDEQARPDRTSLPWLCLGLVCSTAVAERRADPPCHACALRPAPCACLARLLLTRARAPTRANGPVNRARRPSSSRARRWRPSRPASSSASAPSSRCFHPSPALARALSPVVG